MELVHRCSLRLQCHDHYLSIFELPRVQGLSFSRAVVLECLMSGEWDIIILRVYFDIYSGIFLFSISISEYSRPILHTRVRV